MQEYIFFSKSNWSEPPRLRHQVANLVRSFGGKVLFFEKPAQWGRERIESSIKCIGPDLRTVRTRQLIHHQLRLARPLRALNAGFEIDEIRKALEDIDTQESIIINFNYDYYFLREIFPHNTILTIINDDFVAQARFLDGQHVRGALAKTCAISDAVLVVSYPLADQVKPWCEPHLFFPWSDVNYAAPIENPNRNGVLVWAHIDRRFDFQLLKEAAARRPKIRFHMVGPVADNVRTSVEMLRSSSPNFIFKEFGKLNDLPLTDFFCSAIPYQRGVKDIEAVTMSNKTLQILARGIPLVTHGMPHFYQHEAILRSANIDTFLAGLDFCQENFERLQPAVSDFVSENQATNRFEQLQRILRG